ncbi:MAG: hypothetical protein SCALA702_17760 [Melioribacteraceae bacterium]|nr:MAG: hypothetical protein SCALA702_17760 [Melioribacteraceae bacterium]
MDQRTNKNIKDYIRHLRKTFSNLEKVYLFGSFVKNSENTESDIDVALILSDLNDTQRFEIQVELMKIAYKYDVRIEPHPISSSNFNRSNPFSAEILNTGIELFSAA